MEISQILGIIGIPSIISGIVALIITREMKKRDLRQEEIKRQNCELEKQNKAMMAGVQALIRDRLLQGYDYYADKGYADYEGRENLENLWTQYHALGANGVMDDLRAEFRHLPVRRKTGELVEVNE